jgi:hypothetical protein
MLPFLRSVFEHLINANVQILSKSTKRQINLFEIDTLPEIQFNGFRSPQDYQRFLETFYREVQKMVDQIQNIGQNALNDVLKQFDLARFEVKTFRKQYFPKDQKQVLLGRVVLLKNSLLDSFLNEDLKQRVLFFFAMQVQLLQLLEELFSHRISHIERFYSHKQGFALPSGLPSTKELESYSKGQLLLFPIGSSNTGAHWKRSAVEFAEVFGAIYASNAIKAQDGSNLFKKDFFALMMWALNLPIGHLEGTINKGRSRKNELGSPYLNELANKFKEMVSSKL